MDSNVITFPRRPAFPSGRLSSANRHRRKTRQCLVFEPQMESCPQPARMGVFANNVVRSSKLQRRRRVIGEHG
jgi:hypothetical protein